MPLFSIDTALTGGTLTMFYIRKYFSDLSLLEFHPGFTPLNSFISIMYFYSGILSFLKSCMPRNSVFVTFSKGDVLMIFKV